MFSKKFWAWTGVVCLLLWGARAVGVHVMIWHEAREDLRRYPEFALAPQPLRDTKVADLGAGATIERFGYRIQVPWTKVVAEKSAKSVTVLTFTDGGEMLIWDSPAAMGLASAARGQTAEDRAKAATLYGALEVSSNYEFTAAAMHETGSEIGLFQPKIKNMRATMLLFAKFPHKATAIYSVSGGHFRGFQTGDPKVPGVVQLLLFDEKDRELDLWIGGTKTVAGVTQEQLNAMVASIQPPD